MGRKKLSFRPDALRKGIDDHDLYKMTRDGELRRIRPGVYSAQPRDEDRRKHHIIEIRAAMAKLRADAVVSHISAAALHDLPLRDLGLERVHMTRRPPASGRIGRIRHMHVAPLAPDEVTEVGGMPVTNIARTVVDLARTTDFSRGVAIGDGALNAAVSTEDQLRSAARRARLLTGAGKAQAAVAYMDYRSESPGESLSRIELDRIGAPAAQLQRVIRAGGTRLGRVDFFFASEGIAGEFDGEEKYRDPDPARHPDGSSQVVIEEKDRENELHRCGLIVARWTWKDLHTPGRLARIIDDARELAGIMPAPRIDPPDPRDTYVPRRRKGSS